MVGCGVPDHVDDRFEWDIDKSNRCLRTRRFDFAYASRLFDSNDYYEEADDREYGEERNFCIGLIDSAFITVVYSPRRNRKRLVSAWRSSPKEIETYVRYAGIATQERPRQLGKVPFAKPRGDKSARGRSACGAGDGRGEG
jgi:uncharacterized DUF497 family protein